MNVDVPSPAFPKILRGWRRVTGVALIVLAFTLPFPHAFDSSWFEATIFTIGGILVILSTFPRWLDAISLQLAAIGFSAGACLARACVIVFVSSHGLPTSKLVPSVTVWVVMAGGYVVGAVGASKVR